MEGSPGDREKELADLKRQADASREKISAAKDDIRNIFAQASPPPAPSLPPASLTPPDRAANGPENSDKGKKRTPKEQNLQAPKAAARTERQTTAKERQKLAELKTLGENIRDLEEKYRLEVEKEAKANLWNRLEKTKKAYRKLEAELDTADYEAWVREEEEEALAEKAKKLKDLKKKIQDLEEKYRFEIEKVAKANFWNQLEKAKREFLKLEEELDTASKKAEGHGLKEAGGAGNTPPPPPGGGTGWQGSAGQGPQGPGNNPAENMTPAEKRESDWGLNNIGFIAEKKKNDFWAGVFSRMVNRSESKSTSAKFFENLRKGFERSAEEADKKSQEARSGKKLGFKKRAENYGVLLNNTLKYGTLIFPRRWLMMVGMAAARGSEAAKETRFENEEVMERTRLDIDKAFEEAEKIYKRAQARTGEEKVSADALKDAYLMEMPTDIQKRLEDATVANGTVQRIFRADVERSINRLNGKIAKINLNTRLTATEKRDKIEKLLKSWEKNLKDYDRVLDKYGTVDELAMWGKYAQTAGRAVVWGATALSATKLVLSIPDLWQNISNVLGRIRDIEIPIGGGSGGAIVKEKLDSLLKSPVAESTAVAPDSTVSPDSIVADSSTAPAPAPLEEAGSDTPAETREAGSVDPNAVIKPGDGIENAFQRQIIADPEKFGYEGDPTDEKAVKAFAGRRAHELAEIHGYVDGQGGEVRVGRAGVAYQLEVDADGRTTVFEFNEDGKRIEPRPEGSVFESADPEGVEKYEYLHGEEATSEPEPAHEEKREEKHHHPREPEEIREDIVKKMEKMAPDVAPGEVQDITGKETFTPYQPSEVPGKEARFTPYQNPGPEVPEPGNRAQFNPYQNPPPDYPNPYDRRGTFTPYNDPYYGPGYGGVLGWLGNELPLTREVLMEMNDIYKDNLENIFSGNDEKLWTETVRNMPARDLLNGPITDERYYKLGEYLQMLQEETGMKPGRYVRQNGSWTKYGPETAEKFIERALKQAARMGILRKMRLE